MITLPTKNEMRQQIVEYQLQIHPTIKYRKTALTLLCDMWKKSQRKKEDLWDEASALTDVASNNKINGAVLKGAFRKFIQTRQGGRCCYCSSLLLNIAHAKPIEHILPRLAYPQFSLHFWNLAVSCVDCNLIKSKSIWGSIDTAISVYPNPVAFSDMYHPRFHLYREHIEYFCFEKNGSNIAAYKGLTAQGRQLCIDLLDKVAAKRVVIEGNDELQKAMCQISEYQEKINNIESKKFSEFAKSLNESVLAFLEE